MLQPHTDNTERKLRNLLFKYTLIGQECIDPFGKSIN